MKFLPIALIVLAMAIAIHANAQDTYFSQYYASPLSINPANTGFFDGDLRFTINERQQWWNVGYNDNATSISIDAKIMRERIPEDDVFAIGFSGIFENSLNGVLKSDLLSFSTAYHKSLASNGSQTLGLGIQANLMNRHFDYNKLTFGTQFNGRVFDPTISVDLNFANTLTNYFDVNAGLLYAAHLYQANLYVGASLYHINKPSESLFNASDSQIPLRKAVHAGGDINISHASSILFSGYYMQQDKATYAMFGGAYGLKTDGESDQNIGLYFGLWYQLHSSYIPYLGADYQNFSVGLNYGLSSTTDLNFTPHTFEVSLIYKIKSNQSRTALCPRF